MIKALLQLVFVSLLIPSIFWVAFKFYGMQKSFYIRSHEFTEQEISSFKKIEQLSWDEIKGLESQVVLDIELQRIEKNKQASLYVKHNSIAELELTQVLRDLPNHRFLVRNNLNIIDSNSLMMKAVTTAEAKNRVLIYSKYGNVIRNLKDESPDLLLAAPESDFVKLHILNMLKLQEFMPLEFDAYIFSPYSVKKPYLTQVMIDELLRRKKLLIIDLTEEANLKGKTSQNKAQSKLNYSNKGVKLFID